jgi:hypothetical protein
MPPAAEVTVEQTPPPQGPVYVVMVMTLGPVGGAVTMMMPPPPPPAVEVETGLGVGVIVMVDGWTVMSPGVKYGELP